MVRFVLLALLALMVPGTAAGRSASEVAPRPPVQGTTDPPDPRSPAAQRYTRASAEPSRAHSATVECPFRPTPSDLSAAMAADPSRAPAAVSALTENPDSAAVLSAVHQVFEGMGEADSAKVRARFHEGARFAGVAVRNGRREVTYQPVDGWIRAIAESDGRWRERIYDVTVHVDGDMASVWAPYTFYLDGQLRHCGVNSIELVRTDDGWQVTQITDTRRREGCPQHR